MGVHDEFTMGSLHLARLVLTLDCLYQLPLRLKAFPTDLLRNQG